jgi:hypothetical protein
MSNIIEKTFKLLDNLGIRLFESLYLVALVLSMDDAFCTNRWTMTCEAEIAYIFIWVV